MIGSNSIRNWQAAAINWMAKQTKFERNDSLTAKKQNKISRLLAGQAKPNYLSVSTTKNYHEPL